MEKTRVMPGRSIWIDRVMGTRWVLAGIYLLFLLHFSPAQPVTAHPAGRSLLTINANNHLSLPNGVLDGALAWGDYDNDGDLDLLASGTTDAGTGRTTLYTNNGGTFTGSTAGLEQVQASSAAWGDYDNDGYLDLLLTGYLRVESGSNVIAFAGVYHNEAVGGGQTFVLKQSLPNIYWGSATWGDSDNDGLLDILLTGYTDGAAPFARLYLNTGQFSGSTIFTRANLPSITPIGFSATAWGDYDRNGYADFVILGRAAGDTPITQVYHNDRNNNYTVTSLTGVWDGTVNFIDYDLDGYLDLLVTGNTGTNVSPNIHPATILYRYTPSSNSFVAVANTGLPNIWNSSVSIGDYNNDGYPDIALAGKALANQPIALPNQVYINNKNGTFSNANLGLPDGAGHVLAWGDYNGDNTLDLALTGVTVIVSGQETYYTYIYPNTPSPRGNTVPTAPALQSACWDGGDRLTLRWSTARDDPLSTNSLTYNLRIGTAPDNQNIVSSASDLSTGRRRVPAMGNLSTSTATVINGLPTGTYYWSVQAVDAGYAGGPFDINSGEVINLGTYVAIKDSYSVDDSQKSVPFNVLANDAGGGSPLSIYRYSTPSHGTLTLDPDNKVLLYTPDEPYDGNDRFTYYAIRDDTLYCSSTTVDITVRQHNDRPTDISLSNNLVPDGSPIGTLVGSLFTTDPDMNQTFTYALAQRDDYSAFRISGNLLLTNAVVHYNTKSTYKIGIQTTDQGGLSFEKDFTILVITNHTPTNILLSNASVLEHQDVGTSVGSLLTTDPDTSDTFAYTLVPDPNNPNNNYDNDQFFILGGGQYLRTNAIFDFNTRSTYHVRIRTTDLGGLYFEKVFTITITPTIPSLFWLDSIGKEHPNSQPPPAVVMSEDGADSYGQPDPFHLIVLAKDEGINEKLSWSIARQASHGSASASGVTITGQTIEIGYTPQKDWNSGDGRGNDSFTVRVTDSGGRYVDLPVAVTIAAINDPPYFNEIKDQTYINLPALIAIRITGIIPGPTNEHGQDVQMAAYCMANNHCNSSRASNLSVSAVQTDGSAILTFTLGTNIPADGFSIAIVARDNQPLNNTFSHNVKVFTVAGVNYFIPLIEK